MTASRFRPPHLPAAPPLPALALPPRPKGRRGLWALPFLISLAFVAVALGWLQRNEQGEVEQQRADLITDALSMQTQLGQRIEQETEQLEAFGSRLDREPPDATGFAAAPEVQQGLHRFWTGLTWLDAANRIVADLPMRAAGEPPPVPPASGISAHLRVPLASGGALVARYSPSEVLRQNVPWWLARKYDMRLVDSFDNVIATTTDSRDPGDRQSYRISLAPSFADGWLELIARDRVPRWYQGLPVVLTLGFLGMIAAITAMLRRQVRDVSRAEAAWRTEAAWRSAMEDSLTVGLRARDLDGRVLYVNRAFCDLVGHPPEALEGALPPMPYWPPDAIEESMQRHRRNMQGDAPRGGYEVRWQHRDGRPIDVMLFETRLVDAGGRHVGWMGSVVDNTARNRLADRERRHIETMTHHARLTMLGEIASTLAHELNQPLSAISSYNAGVLNSLQRGAAGGQAIEPTVLRALQRLGEQAAHAGRIVQRIRQFLTRREPQLEPVELNAVVEGGVALLAREAGRQQVQRVLALDPARPTIVADAVLIEQIVINLVRNAIDALGEVPAGRERRIEVRTGMDTADTGAADTRRVRIDVLDNGPGLQGRPIEALCAPFYSTKRDGMGMGLAICRSIVEAHQGRLEVAEAPGGGAWFTLTLPVEPRAARDAAGALLDAADAEAAV